MLTGQLFLSTVFFFVVWLFGWLWLFFVVVVFCCSETVVLVDSSEWISHWTDRCLPQFLTKHEETDPWETPQ